MLARSNTNKNPASRDPRKELESYLSDPIEPVDDAVAWCISKKTPADTVPPRHLGATPQTVEAP
jgi:hypothetical protein